MSELLTNLTDIYNDKQKNLLPQNLKQNITCLGVTGTLKELKGQTKTVTPTATTQTVMPDTNYNGLTAVTVNGDANLVGENIKSGVTIFNVTGTHEGSTGNNGDVPVKLFETEEELYADTEATEGDLAVVYTSTIQNVTVDSRFQTARFPAVVVLPEALTDYVDVMYRATDESAMFDCWGNLDANYFMMDCYTETGSIRIQYESSDGITYTRTDGGDEIVDFGTEIYYARPDYWNDVIGHFIQASSQYFGGLYEYRNTADDNWYDVVTKYNVDTVNKIITSENELVYLPTLSIVLDKFSKTEGISTFAALRYNNEYYIQTEVTGTRIQQDITNNKKYSGEWSSAAIVGKVSKIYKLNLEDNTYEYVEDITSFRAFTRASNTWYNVELYMDGDIVALYVSGSLYSDNLVWVIENDVNYDYNQFDYSQTKIHHTVFPHYTYASAQLSFNNPNQILPGKIAYGKKGVITGDGTIYDNLDYTIVNEKYFENPNTTTTLQCVGSSAFLPTNGYKIKKLIRDNTSTSNFYVYHNVGNVAPVSTSFKYSYSENTVLVFNNKVYIRNGDSPLDILEIDINTGEQYNFTPPATGFTGWASFCINRQAGLLFASSLGSGQVKICKYDLVNRTSSVLTTVTTTSKKIEYIGLMGYDEKLDLLYFTTGNIWGNVEPADIYSVNSSGNYTKVVTTTLREGYTDPAPLCTDNYIVLAIGALDSSDTTYKIYYKTKGETSFKSITGTNIKYRGPEFTNAVAYDNGDGYLLIRVYDGTAKKNHVIKINTTNNTSEKIENMDIIPYNLVLGKTDNKLLSIQGMSDLNGYNYVQPLSVSGGKFYNYANYGTDTIQQITVDSSGSHLYDYIPVKTTDLSDTTDGMLVALLYSNGSFSWHSISDLNYNILGNKSVE